MSDNIKSRSLTSKNHSPMQEGCRDFVCPLCKPLNSSPPHSSNQSAGERISVKREEKFSDCVGLGLLWIPRSITQEQSHQDLNVLLVRNDPACSCAFWNPSRRANQRAT